MIRALIFDCFGVLTKDVWREFAATLPEEQWRDASDSIHAYDSGFISRQEFFDSVKAITGRLPIEVETMTTGEAPKNTELLLAIADFKSQYKISLLSNIATNWVSDVFLTASEQQLFDDMVFSHQVHMAKPDPNIFRLAAERLNVNPNECVFIDDVERNCDGARSAGMQAICYQDMPQFGRDITALLANSN